MSNAMTFLQSCVDSTVNNSLERAGVATIEELARPELVTLVETLTLFVANYGRKDNDE